MNAQNQSILFPALSNEIIQGGMGVAISDYKLAREVANEGMTGIVSGTAIGEVLARRLQDGDPTGEIRDALTHFPNKRVVLNIMKKYYQKDGLRPDGSRNRYFTSEKFSLDPSELSADLAVVGAFVEVWLAKQHAGSGNIGMNLLTKIQEPTLHSIYGAMLADVDILAMGAGVPEHVPPALGRLAIGETVNYPIHVAKASPGEYSITFDPSRYNPKNETLKIPKFLAIVAREDVAQYLVNKPYHPDGFIIESQRAGGHNAPAKGSKKDEKGQPIYSEADAPDITKFHEIGLPFWLAGGYGSHEGLQQAKRLGAFGVQVGSVFALSQESGLDGTLKKMALDLIWQGQGFDVNTSTRVSPTGFPFKVASLEGTLSDDAVYESRQRVCDLGYLRQAIKTDGEVEYRCTAEPAVAFERKGGLPIRQIGAVCLCNSLMSAAGIGQERRGNPEPAIVTLGDDAVEAARRVGPPLTVHRIIQYLRYGHY